MLKLVRYGDKVVFQAPNGKYVTAWQNGGLEVQATTIQGFEQFEEARSVMLVNELIESRRRLRNLDAKPTGVLTALES